MIHTELLRLMAEHMVAGTTDTKAQVAGKIRQHLFATRPNPDLPGDVVERAFVVLCQKYVQRADARQKEMGLQYTEAETHDLAELMARFALTAASADLKPVREALEEAREAFLDMIADARDWHDEPDGDETGDYTTLHLITHHSQMGRLIEALGIKQKYCETVADAIDRELGRTSLLPPDQALSSINGEQK